MALRLSKKHDVLIGSRELDKAKELASGYTLIAKSFYKNVTGKFIGLRNSDVACSSDITVISVPYQHILQLAKDIRYDFKKDSILLSPAAYVEFEREDAPTPKIEGKSNSLAEAIAKLIPEVRVVSAFQTISASKLAKLELVLDYDILVATDSKEAYSIVAKFIEDIPNLRPLYAGSLSYSRILESLTQLLINSGRLNKLKSPSLKIV